MNSKLKEDNIDSIVGLSISICNDLRGSMLAYCKKTLCTHRSDILMDFVRRIERNVSAMAVLARESRKHKMDTYFKLPMGLILRNGFMDMIQAFYFVNLNDVEFEEEIEILNRDYVKSFKFRKTLCTNRCKDSNMEDVGDLIYSLSVEDNFTEYLAFDKEMDSDGLLPCVDDDVIRTQQTQIVRTSNLGKIYKWLKEHDEHGELIGYVYGYYKYFSQYEHFSEKSHGDSLASWEEDNVSWNKALTTLKEAANYIVEMSMRMVVN